MARLAWSAAGFVCLGLGWLGLITPGMPGFVFLIGALFCFGKGNPKWAQRMLDHPAYGPPLRDWTERRFVSRKAKISAIVFMAITGAVTAYFLEPRPAMIAIGCMVAVSVWLWTRKE